MQKTCIAVYTNIIDADSMRLYVKDFSRYNKMNDQNS